MENVSESLEATPTGSPAPRPVTTGRAARAKRWLLIIAVALIAVAVAYFVGYFRGAGSLGEVQARADAAEQRAFVLEARRSLGRSIKRRPSS